MEEMERSGGALASPLEESVPAEPEAAAPAVSNAALPDAALPDPDGPSPVDPAIKALIEAIVYVADEPLTGQQIASGCGRPVEEVKRILEALIAEYAQPDRGLMIREVAGGYQVATKPEHHEGIGRFVQSRAPHLKLSLPAFETLAVIAFRQPITAPEIQQIRGVQGAGALKPLLDRKLITTAGRKAVIGRPILYKTTREFLLQFGLKDLAELPTLKEFEELRRLAMDDEPVLGGRSPVEVPGAVESAAVEPAAEGRVETAAGGRGEHETGGRGEYQTEAPVEAAEQVVAGEEPVETGR